MRKCWQEDPEHRPQFIDIVNSIVNMMEESEKEVRKIV